MIRKSVDVEISLTPEQMADEFARFSDDQQARVLSEVGGLFHSVLKGSWQMQICWIANSSYLTDAGREWILELADHIRAQKLKGNE